MRSPAAFAALSFVLACATPADAQDRPITHREPDAIDVAKTPMTDLNLSRTEIPALLVEAQKRPYSVQNLDTCSQLAAAVTELDGVLGPDLDLPQTERVRFSKGRIAQWVVGSFIPFRSLIREVSGANRQQREIGDAIQAGLARRGFLKGVGTARDCPYPASPATESIVEQHATAIVREDQQRPGAVSAPLIAPDPDVITAGAISPAPLARPQPVFTAKPVVQSTR